LPLPGLWAHQAKGAQILLGLPLPISHGLMPLLDALIGEDGNNPPAGVVPQLEADRYYRYYRYYRHYRWLIWATVPLHFAARVACAAWVGTHDLSGPSAG
jgi:alkane 1-monooxygenase